ncbi:unnamed protein product, partial [Vitis vinifera]
MLCSVSYLYTHYARPSHCLFKGAPETQACAEDIAMWVKKYISVRGHEFFLLTMLTKRGIRVFVEGKEYAIFFYDGAIIMICANVHLFFYSCSLCPC